MIEVIHKATSRATAGRRPGADPYVRDAKGRFARVNAALGSHTSFRFARNNSTAFMLERLEKHIIANKKTEDLFVKNKRALVSFVMHAHNLSLSSAVEHLRSKNLIGSLGAYKRVGWIDPSHSLYNLKPDSDAFRSEVKKRKWTSVGKKDIDNADDFDEIGRRLRSKRSAEIGEKMFFMLHDASLHKQWHSQRTGARKSGLNVPVGLMVKDRKMLEHFDSTWMATYRKHANRPKGYDIDHVIPKAHFYFSNKAIIDFVNGPKNTSLLKSADNKLKSNRIENPTTGKPYYPRVPKAVLNSFHYDALLKHYKYEKATGHKFMGSTSITQAMLDDAQKNRNKKTYLAKVRSRKLQGL